MKKICWGTGLLMWLFTSFVQAAPLRLATTTSTDNSGLMRELLPYFEAKTGYKVHVIAVGTGQALRLGRDGNVDVVLVHAPKAELQFVEAGYGINRRQVMSNDFVFVGPKHDPAGLRRLRDSVQALQRIAATQSLFISRGDDSGTHKKERSLWEKLSQKSDPAWYREAGQGMGRTLQIAGELDAYTLTDRGTWLVFRKRLPLELLVEGDPRLHNPYGIIAVNPKRHPHVNHQGALALIDWITSDEGKHLIREFKLEGRHLFVPIETTD
jgi:tungstate transport system substrate-binding protein